MVTQDLNFEAYCDLTKHTAPKGVWVVEGYAATSDLDSQNDIIAQSALDMGVESLHKYQTVLYNHNSDRPIGTILEAKSMEGHLFIKVGISKTEPDIWEKVKDGTLSKFSIRGRVTDHEIFKDQLTGKEIFMIKGMDLYEVSLVSVPANVHAKALGWYIEKAMMENTEEKTLFKQFLDTFKAFINKPELIVEKGGVDKLEEKTEEAKPEVKSEPEVKKSEEKKDVTLEIDALRDVISQLKDIGKSVTEQSEVVKKSLEDVAKAKEEIAKAKEDMAKMVSDLNSVVKEIPLRKAQAAEAEKPEDRKEDNFETLTKSESYQKQIPADKLFTIFKELEKKAS